MTQMTEERSITNTNAMESNNIMNSADDSLIICETHGTECISNQFQNNLHVAHALHFMPVHLVLLTMKASVNIESVVATIKDYMELDVTEFFKMGFCITHMDTVDWKKDELDKCLKSTFKIENTIFSWLEKDSSKLLQEIKKLCSNNSPEKNDIDSKKFSNIFDIDDNDMKIIQNTKKKVTKFQKRHKDFVNIKLQDEISEFQKKMDAKMEKIQNKFKEKFDIKLSGENRKSRSDIHITNLRNQLLYIRFHGSIEPKKDCLGWKMNYNKDIDFPEVGKDKNSCKKNLDSTPQLSQNLKQKEINNGIQSDVVQLPKDNVGQNIKKEPWEKESKGNVGIYSGSTENGKPKKLEKQKRSEKKDCDTIYREDPDSSRDDKLLRKKQQEESLQQQEHVLRFYIGKFTFF